jgi:hypothetical protein
MTSEYKYIATYLEISGNRLYYASRGINCSGAIIISRIEQVDLSPDKIIRDYKRSDGTLFYGTKLSLVLFTGRRLEFTFYTDDRLRSRNEDDFPLDMILPAPSSMSYDEINDVYLDILKKMEQ